MTMKEVNSSTSNLISSDEENENIDGKQVGGFSGILSDDFVMKCVKFPLRKVKCLETSLRASRA